MEPLVNQPLQITIETWQAIIGICVFVFATGAAWATLKGDVRHLHGDIDEVKDGMKSLSGRFDLLLRDLALQRTSEGRMGSPMIPSEKGSVLLVNSGVRAVIADTAFRERFFILVDKRGPKSGYEVEQSIFSVLLDIKNDSCWDPVKEFIFTHPIVDDSPLTMERLFIIASWVLREEYMHTRKIPA